MFVKKIFLLTVAVLFCTSLSAQEGNSNDVRHFAIGGGSTFSPAINGGGHGEFVFLIYHNGLDVRDHLVIRGNSITDKNDTEYGTFTLSEKISFGGISPNKLMRVYGFMEGGIGFWGNEAKALFKTPLTFIFGGGGGTDIFFAEYLSVYLEAGWLGHFLETKTIGGPIFQIGWRGHF
jgi:hypothetical protein